MAKPYTQARMGAFSGVRFYESEFSRELIFLRHVDLRSLRQDSGPDQIESVISVQLFDRRAMFGGEFCVSHFIVDGDSVARFDCFRGRTGLGDGWGSDRLIFDDWRLYRSRFWKGGCGGCFFTDKAENLTRAECGRAYRRVCGDEQGGVDPVFF